MSAPKISVIVPVYNGEKTIERCINSILLQSFPGFELIVVDDGSVDNTLSVIEQCAVSDSRVRVIHEANSGVSHARNEGMKEANGEFFCFCDADDVVEPVWLSDLYENAIKYPDAFIVSNIDIQECDRRYLRYRNFGGLMPIEKLWEKGEWGNPINKIFAKKVIDELEISFDITQKVHEDELFVGQYGSAFDYAFVCERVGYHYLNLEPLGEKYSGSLTLENAYYEYFHLKEYNPLCSRYLVDRLLMGVYDSILKCGADIDSSVSRFKKAVGPDIAYVNGKKKVGFRFLRLFNGEYMWRIMFKFYLRFKLI